MYSCTADDDPTRGQLAGQVAIDRLPGVLGRLPGSGDHA